MKKEEIWKDIKGYEGLYQVSNLGRIKALDRVVYYETSNQYKKYNSKMHLKEHLLVPQLNRDKYYYIVLSKNNKKKTLKVHRLVAEAFIPNSKNLPFVNHKDENKLNNCVDNLEWCTCAYNNSYGSACYKRMLSNGTPINQYTVNGEFIRRFNSAKEAGRCLGISASKILDNCKRLRKKLTYKGYIWRYVEEVTNE